ncbi:hypothetical protein LOK49_LG03G00921 [Camellia lanceoleosa]|uniref:Uncharacterized protein n=1 Tax=Camellia lanceoleosa TaxID=1840588 RepID=A0ACC0IFC0_9ERIC|nr:hypothetical protein LOK49_LG03G00921 [Camellia lanceoleosa]
MALSTLKLVRCCLPPTVGANETTVKKSLLPLQVRSKEEQEQEAPKALFTVSRRDTLLYLAAASLSGVTLMSTRPVEARVGKIENKRKAMKKLEKLREKAEEKTTPRQPLTKEGRPPIPLPPMPSPFPGSERKPAERSV